MKDRATGEFRERNIDVVVRLENEYSSNQRKIFIYYITKLFVQLFIAVASVAISSAVFRDFSVSFPCQLHREDFPQEWSIAESKVVCAFSSLKTLETIRDVDYILAIFAVFPIVFGLLWCGYRHTTELGHRDISQFSFTSGLPPDCFVFPSVIKSPKGARSWKARLRLLLSPRISNDLDFLVMRLFKADAGVGQVFRDIQVEKELKHLLDEDHELLHLFFNAQQDQHYRSQLWGMLSDEIVECIKLNPA